jgi:sugar lactone lactonase YvrE
MQYSQVQLLAGKGNRDDCFSAALRGVAVDRRGFVYAAGDREIKVFDAAGRLRRRWSTARPPLSVAVTADGRVFTGQAGQVEIFDGAGGLLDTWRDEARLGLVTAAGFFRDNVFLADARDRSIRRYDSGGKHLNDIGSNNRMKGFLIPNGVVSFGMDGKGVLHAANPGKHRVERYTPEGELLGHFGRFDGRNPAGFSGCCNPTNVAVTDGARVWVTEKAGPRAKVYDSEGGLMAVIAADAFDPNCKNMSIAAGPRGRVYVADTVKLQIFVFGEAA